MKKEATVFLAPHSRDAALLDFFSCETRKRFWISRSLSGAESNHWANGAKGVGAKTNGRAQFHHGLIVIPRRVVGQECCCKRGKRFGGAGGVAKLCGICRKSGENSD